MVHLTPIEKTLYRLFQAHPEGLRADDLPLCWKELCAIYAQESRYDELALQEDKVASLCAEDKVVFYSTVSRIKRSFRNAMGARKASAFIIRRGKDGVYRLKATPEPR